MLVVLRVIDPPVFWGIFLSAFEFCSSFLLLVDLKSSTTGNEWLILLRVPHPFIAAWFTDAPGSFLPDAGGKLSV